MPLTKSPLSQNSLTRTMTRKLAIDWDDQQIRMIVGESAGKNTRITDAAIVSISEAGVAATLKQMIAQRGLDKTVALVAVGRDQAELRQMEFPPVPLAELPDMVRFQAIRTFASAGDVAIVDYLPTEVPGSDGRPKAVRAIVSASGPVKLDPIRKTTSTAGLTIGRIALRPIAAAALYQIAGADRVNDSTRATLALIDLVGDEAEIVLFRGRDVSFVRSVRLPSDGPARINALAGELRRSLIACGAGGENCDVTIWGSPERHQSELSALAEKLDEGQSRSSRHQVLNPFDLITVDASVRKSVGETVGRLAPLVGLLVADAGHGDLLIDFENPRERVEVKPDRRKQALAIGLPAAAVLLLIWGIYSQFASLDSQIAGVEAINAKLRTDVKAADASVAKTDRVDAFLDGDVLWLEEFERLAATMPPADQLILKSVSASGDARAGGGSITISGLVTSPAVIDEFEASLRDERHKVVGDGASQINTKDAYRWQVRETITVPADAVRRERYARIDQQLATEAATATQSPASSTPPGANQ